MNTAESKYVTRKLHLSELALARERAFSEADGKFEKEFASEAEWLRCVTVDFPKFIPFLTRQCGVEFSGRVLEIGAGGAWLSAELSKLPKVVEVIATDFSATRLKEQAPKVFRLLHAHGQKITRTPADFHRLDFPANHFDFVVCAGALQHALNVLEVLQEARRVLKPGGSFVAVREPFQPQGRGKRATDTAIHSVAEYEELFRRAGFEVVSHRL